MKDVNDKLPVEAPDARESVKGASKNQIQILFCPVCGPHAVRLIEAGGVRVWKADPDHYCCQRHGADGGLTCGGEEVTILVLTEEMTP